MGEKARHKLIIIGAGASGMMAGCAAGSLCDDVLILDANNVAGKKLLATGNGKCNFTNIFVRDDKFNRCRDDSVMDIYDRFDFEDVLAFFEKLGVPVRIRDGYCYPYSQEASSVRDALVSRLKELNVKIKLSNRVSKVKKDAESGFFSVITTDGYTYEAEKVILSCAGYAGSAFGCDGSVYDILRSLGNTEIIKPLPALTGLLSPDPVLKELAGVRVYARVSLITDGEVMHSDSGEIIFSGSGVSGIPVMNLSRYASRLLDEGNKCLLRADFFEDISEEELEKMLKNMLHGRKVSVREAFTGLLNHKLLGAALRLSSNESFFSDSEDLHIKGFVNILKNFELEISGTNGFDNAQVTTGGLSLDCINTKTMEAKFCPGLYVTGETLDVDGCCGGYNLQWAWTTGAIAGVSAVVGEFDKKRI